MKKTFLLISLLVLIGCRKSQPQQKVKSDKELMNSVALTPAEIKAKSELKRELMKIAQKGSNAPTGLILSKDSTKITTNKFKGKLLIIDFWATWCSPCLKEAPKFKELERKYENEKVEFITISVDDEFPYWKDYIIENNWETDNYWYGMKEMEPFFSYMYSEMEIEGESNILISLPKYVIISPDGKILDNQAPKPSNPKFEKEIERLIKEHAT